MIQSIAQNIYLVGMMGCGKSYVGRTLARLLEVEFVDMDTIIENEEQKSIATIFEDDGAEYFRQIESTVLKDLSKGTPRIISTGGGAPCYHEGMNVMLKTGRVVWLQRSIADIYSVIYQDTNRPLARGITMNSLKAMYRNRKAIYNQAHHKVRNNAEAEMVARRLLKKIS